jgi:Fe-S oxidoreductase
MATRNEQDTTRARANILREMLTHSTRENPFDHHEIYEVMDLCLSCKGCKSECPSNVDIAKLKAEFLQHYYEANGTPLRARMIANITSINKINVNFPGLYNWFIKNRVSKAFINNLLGFSPDRSLPGLQPVTLKKWAHKNPEKLKSKLKGKNRPVLFYADEFINYQDAHIGIDAIELLTSLGYDIIIPELEESGRTFLSKGLVKKAKQLAEKNMHLAGPWIEKEIPLIGLEPSAILTFRDEYMELTTGSQRKKAEILSERVYTFEEFFSLEYESGYVNQSQFTKNKATILVHGHCYQKALSNQSITERILSIPENYEVSIIPSGCCGMAGSFGFEKEHYEISMKIGELVLFPAIQNAPQGTLLAAAGTSCRHQILDGTGETAWHPAQILKEGLMV